MLKARSPAALRFTSKMNFSSRDVLGEDADGGRRDESRRHYMREGREDNWTTVGLDPALRNELEEVHAFFDDDRDGLVTAPQFANVRPIDATT